jgi:hypothetical protein
MTRPWFQMFSRDWLDNKELRRCSPAARAVLVDMMCLANEGTPYGFLADDIGALTDEYMASRCVMPVKRFVGFLAELRLAHRVEEKDGVLFIPRMVRDEEVRVRRAEGGKQSIGHPNTPPPKQKEGYPSDDPYMDPSLSNRGDHHSRARARADSVCVSVSASKLPGNGNTKSQESTGFPQWFDRWKTLTGREVNEIQAARAWTCYVSIDDEQKAFDCLERYGASGEVSRGIVRNPDKFISEESENGWKSKWQGPPKTKQQRDADAWSNS